MIEGIDLVIKGCSEDALDQWAAVARPQVHNLRRGVSILQRESRSGLLATRRWPQALQDGRDGLGFKQVWTDRGTISRLSVRPRILTPLACWGR